MILIAFLLLLAGGGVAVWLAFAEPAGWADVTRLINEVPEGERAAVGEGLQKRFFNALQGLDGSTDVNVPAGTDVGEELDRVREVKLSIPVRDANLWLMTQLPSLLKNQNGSMPKGIADPRVWIENSQLVLSCRVSLAGINGIASFGLESKLLEDGQLSLKVNRVQTGKLRVPAAAVAAAVEEEFKKAKDEVVRRVGDAFDGTTIDPIFADPGDPKRETRIINFKIHPDRLDLTLRNGPRKAK